jgi:hypothetical protein
MEGHVGIGRWPRNWLSEHIEGVIAVARVEGVFAVETVPLGGRLYLPHSQHHLVEGKELSAAMGQGVHAMRLSRV